VVCVLKKNQFVKWFD